MRLFVQASPVALAYGARRASAARGAISDRCSGLGALVYGTSTARPCGVRGKISQLFANACGRVANSLKRAFQFFACYAEVPDPTLDVTLSSNLTTIRHNSLRKAALHELLHCVHSARSFPRRAITVDLVYFLLRVCGQSLLVCVHASRGTEPHAPVKMYTRSQLSAAMIAA